MLKLVLQGYYTSFLKVWLKWLNVQFSSIDDAGAHSGKPPKAIKTQIRQMQPLSRLILYRAVHCEVWSKSLPHDLINMAVDDILKRVTEARVSEQIIHEL